MSVVLKGSRDPEHPTLQSGHQRIELIGRCSPPSHAGEPEVSSQPGKWIPFDPKQGNAVEMNATSKQQTIRSRVAMTQGIPLEKATLHGKEVISTPVGDITLVDNYFDDDAAKRLYDEMDYQRAAQCYLWSTPLVSVTTWRDRQAEAYGVTGETDFVVLRSLKEKRGIVTANLTTPTSSTSSASRTGHWRSSTQPGRPLAVSWTSGNVRSPISV